ncbi:Alanine racemase [Rhynchospora pubera]|uniref:Alanine racemase n=1 Tax=Rhynchospora pubera TaxID=906938 RepID=A0AAV8F6I5_9POAL|nr:Alanine racemase [Rhynchospora pubera]
MSCTTTLIQPKLLSMHFKFLQSLVRNCLKATNDLSSEDKTKYYDLNTKYVILKELRSRSIRASSKSSKFIYFQYQTSWPSLFRPSDNINEQKEVFEDASNNDNESESFFSAKSNFSSYSSQCEITAQKSVFKEFKHVEGWLFGLWRQPVVQLPPLPPTPADFWMWVKRNSELKHTTILHYHQN